ncbi:MAG: chromate transporter, partial [Erysipelotrichaceae bacterium]
LATRYPWFDLQMLTNLIAVSESTPGPIGINMATYAGFHAAGIIGGFVASIALVLPSLIIILSIAKVMDRIKDHPMVTKVFTYLRPTTMALITSVAISIFMLTLFQSDAIGTWSFFQVPQLILFGIVLVIALKTNKHPIVYLLLCMVAGILLQL